MYCGYSRRNKGLIDEISHKIPDNTFIATARNCITTGLMDNFLTRVVHRVRHQLQVVLQDCVPTHIGMRSSQHALRVHVLVTLAVVVMHAMTVGIAESCHVVCVRRTSLMQRHFHSVHSIHQLDCLTRSLVSSCIPVSSMTQKHTRKK